ncbi:MAG TPA: M20 family metallopeptidase [Thermoanaerobaculia bacterium]|nr:M20 family metallopeptidase [Thermoanaerobaculia bacterium]
MDPSSTTTTLDQIWNQSIVPTLEQYIKIPNQSPLFDPDWKRNGHMHKALGLAKSWVEGQRISGLKVEAHEIEGRTPLLMIEVSGDPSSTILMYGHLDKQPAMTGWDKGLGAWTPVLRDSKLYGRGGADDGYAVFSAVSAIAAVQQQSIRHARIVVLIECCEESGSTDLPAYIDLLSDRIGTPRLVICLDSGCGNYEQLWMTTSLRGSIVGNLIVEVLSEGVHSGDASGIVPSSVRILRILLDRLEDSKTGRMIPDWLQKKIPPNRIEQTRATARVLGTSIHDKFPFLPGMRPVTDDPVELLLNRTWRPTLSITGQAGMPDLVQGGNVLRPMTALKLSIRLPPNLDARNIDHQLKELLESNPPYGARVTFEAEKGAGGWEAPKVESWLGTAVDRASRTFFGKPAVTWGEGGSIPFMGMLGERYPEAQFLITGVLGPRSNAHGPNEFLDIEYAKKVTACVAEVIAAERA